MKKILILGSGAAGVSAAEAARKQDPDAEITVLSRETELPYNRPMLTKKLCDSGICPERIAIHPGAWYQEHRIQRIDGKQAEKILKEESAVTDTEGNRYAYDSLILALGASCFIPPIAGSDSDHVHTVRTVEDVKKIQSLLAGKKHAVVIGGGVLGLEAAWSLCQDGISVTVLEAMPRLMPRQLDAETAEHLMKIAADKGIRILTGEKITAIEEGRVVSESGSYEADAVIVSAGVRASVQLAKDAGIVCERAIVINDRAETSEKNIYACGDCAQLNGVNYALWSQALLEGSTAGCNAAGGQAAFRLEPPALTFFGLNTTLFAAGDNSSKPDTEYTCIYGTEDQSPVFRKCTFLEGKLCGVELIGTMKEMRSLQKALNEHAGLAETEALLR